MLACMFLSIIFLLTDAAVSAAKVTASSGINPYWRFALVFKCASDTIFLDDFKSVLDDILARKLSSVADTTRRGSRSRARGPHKRSWSTSREEFIQGNMLEPPDTPSPSIQNSQSTYKRSSLRSFFSFRSEPYRSSTETPMIQVHPPTETESLHSRSVSPGSGSAQSHVAAPRPVHTLYRNPELRATESDGSLLIGRLV